MKKVKFIFVVLFVFIYVNPVMVKGNDILSTYNNYIDNPSASNKQELKKLLINDFKRQISNDSIDSECFFDKILNNIKLQKQHANSRYDFQKIMENVVASSISDLKQCMKNICNSIKIVVDNDSFKNTNSFNKCIDMITNMLKDEDIYMKQNQIYNICTCFIQKKSDILKQNYKVLLENNNEKCTDLMTQSQETAILECVKNRIKKE